MGLLSPATAAQQLKAQPAPGGGGADAFVESFSQVLSDALNQVNALQLRADTMAQRFATGEIRDLHQVMIAVQEARLAFELTMQIRNKVVDAYQEIMRMQV
ncbi:MAG TPA: flagellar hook-basal body complex protein FliE [Firmicutes bacterium]|nr:flagellar hook-basal body complex protein FliE [Bacillota bacterium]